MKLKMQDRPTITQRRLLITHIKETRCIEGNGRERKSQWVKITNELNVMGPPKTLAQWKKQWQNLRLATRKKLQEISRRHAGSPIPDLTDEDREIMLIESCQPESINKNPNHISNNVDLITRFKIETPSDFPLFSVNTILPTTSVLLRESKRKKTYTRRIKPSTDEIVDNEKNTNYDESRKTDSVQVRARTFRGLCDQAKLGRRKKKKMNSDELFMLSFVEDLKKIPEYKRLDVKTDIIAVFKKWSFKCQETQSDLLFGKQYPAARFQIQHENIFESAKEPFRLVSELSHSNNSLKSSNLSLNSQNNEQPNTSFLHHPIQHHSYSPSLQLNQHQHSQPQQLNQVSLPLLQDQHPPIYHPYGSSNNN